MKKNLTYYSGDVRFNQDLKYIEAAILHYDVPNENKWRPVSGCLDAFFERLDKSGKGVAACYQHDEKQLIGVWRDFETKDNVLLGKLYYIETPFVKETVLPQLEAGILQGVSPSIASYKENYKAGVIDVIEGVLCEISLVGLPADFEADILRMSAKLEVQAEKENNFEIDLLTI